MKAKKPKPQKMGRPSKYDPAFCPLLIEHMKQGGSLEAFATKIKVNRDTLYEWEKVHKDFSDTIKEGKEHLRAFFEDLFRRMAWGQLRRVKKEIIKKSEDGTEEVISREYEPAQGSAAAAIFMAKNMIDWRDKKDINLTGKDGGPIQYADLSAQELKRIIREGLEVLGVEVDDE